MLIFGLNYHIVEQRVRESDSHIFDL